MCVPNLASVNANKFGALYFLAIFSDENSEIQFFDTPNAAPKDHPTGTICRPDIVATRQRGEIHWTGIEATVQLHSYGKTAEGPDIQSALYSIFLLQARPDLLAVQGICVTKAGIMLSITSSSGVKRTEALDMSVQAHRVLLLVYWVRGSRRQSFFSCDPMFVEQSCL